MGDRRDAVVARAYRGGSRFARLLPSGVARDLPGATAPLLSASLRGRRGMLERHLRRASGPGVTASALQAMVRRSMESYVRYYVESFRLPDLTAAEIEAGITTTGTAELWDSLDRGTGAILALPHLGGWEWAGFWLTKVRGLRVSVVVEPLDPPEVFDFFTSFRESLGMTVIPLGSDAAARVLEALADNQIVCLLADRDLQGGGIDVEFFGERTTLPGGPALLALRSGAPVFPTAVYFRPGGGHYGLVRPPLDTERRGRLRADVARVTQDLAEEFELLIREAPDQWHLLQPNWPSDHEWLAARRAGRDPS
ncbi:MAG: phosphatidylinositol mannoside acyltransferase [Actinomycetota bacterium]